MTDGPLAGLKILDLTRLLPGPVCTLHLADLGAEVIKIEDTGVGDYARTMGLGAAPGEDSFFFRVVNRNKRGLRLDLKQAAGVEVFLRLARDADVVVESFRPGVVDKLGVGYTAVQAINPRIVYCAITGYGQDGPWRDRAGHDLNYIATSGVLDQIGTRDGAPAIPNLQIGDLLGGALTAVMGILAAVIGAKATGQGRYVDVAMTDATFAHAYTGLLSVLARHGETSVWRELAKNPLFLSTLAALAWNLLGLPVPAPVGQFLGRLAEAAIALGLLAVGAALKLRGAIGPDGRGAASYFLAVKLLAMPLIALLVARWIGLPGVHFDVVMAFAALPTASSAYILAQRMGGDGPRVAWLISASTLLGMATLPLWLAFLAD